MNLIILLLTTLLTEIGPGYSSTSVNTAVFRTNSVITHGDTQYASYYNPDGYVTLAKRELGTTDWTVAPTQYKGNVSDGHNVISMGVDGEGYLHVAFDHHGHPLHYARSKAPGSLELGEMEPMTGIDEGNVTYPEFYTLSNGDLLFIYRSGASGRGNMAINRYDVATRTWQRVQDSLIDGEEERSPYGQFYHDANDVMHVSWVWRETWLVETNHDLCYARSSDGGRTWQRSDGTDYTLPITASNAEYAWRIPQNSELINQTSMTADAASHPYIVTYWRETSDQEPLQGGQASSLSQTSEQGAQASSLSQTSEQGAHPSSLSQNSEQGAQASSLSQTSEQGGQASSLSTGSIPQYRVIWHDGHKWHSRQITDRKTPFSLSGGGTKMIPVSRPRVVADGDYIAMIFRDKERGSRVSIAETTTGAEGDWTVTDLTDFDVDAWEPSIDTDLWRAQKKLHIFVQPTSQGDGERVIDRTPTPVSILEAR